MKKFSLSLFTCLVFFFQLSCKKDSRKQNAYDPEIPKVSDVKISPGSNGSGLPPEIVPVKNVKVVNAGKPVVIEIKSNISFAGTPVVKSAGSPVINNPGHGVYKLPVGIPAEGKIILAGIPEVIPVKDATIKDNDPESFSSYKILQGLKQPLIRCMMQDRIGNIWFGTYSGGVSKYDGKFFTDYTTAHGLSNDGIWSMLQDRHGNLWFGTYGAGICKYDGKTFTNFPISEGSVKVVVWSILEDQKGNLWFGTNHGVTRYDGTSFTHFTTAEGLSNNLVHSILQDDQQNIWFGTFHGISKYDGKSFSNYTTAHGLINDSVMSMMKDEHGSFWIGTYRGVSRFDGNKFINYSAEQGLNRFPIQCMLKDKSGKIWLGTNKGIIEFDHKPLHAGQSTFTSYTTEEGLGNDNVSSILEDRAGNLWFGTHGGGAARLDGRMFTHYTVSQGLGHNEVMRTVEDKAGNLWFGTWGGGISKYDGKTFTNYTVEQGLSSNNVFSLLFDKQGILWIGTGKGISRFDGQTFTNFAAEQGMTNDEVWSILEDTDGNLWFGSFGSGAFKYDGKNFTRFSHEQGLSNGIVMAMLQDRNGIYWFGTYGGGLNKYDGKSFTNYTTADGLSASEVMDLFQDKRGDLWVGTIGGGVYKFDEKKFTNYSLAQGLSNEIVMGILEDKSGNLWFSTRNGLNRMLQNLSSTDGKEKKSENKPLFKNYMYADGFLGVNSYVNSIFQDSKGDIWIGAGDRLTCYHPEGEIPDTIPPNIHLSNVDLFNEKINWLNLEKNKDTALILSNGIRVGNFEFDSLSKYSNIPSHLSLAHNNNYLTFEYVGITTRSPYKVRYKYKLDGFDENWSGITDRTEAPYGNLPFGNYQFKVKAMNSEGYWSDPLTFSFSIRPPWWKTIWFRSAAFVCILFFLYSIYRYRLNQVLRLQTIRNKIASDLHDDIGSTLNSISIYSEVAKQDSAKHEHALNMIGESSRKIIDAMSDIVWTINPKNDSFENIILRMRSLTYNLMKAKNIEHTFRADEILNSRNLTMEDRRNFYLIYKEAVNNMVKYSQASRAHIVLTEEKQRIKLTIRDNGIGFDTSQYTNGNGLKNMKSRAMEMKANLKIESELKNGTIIELTMTA